MKEVQETSESEPLEKFIGAFDSNNFDWLLNHNYYLGKSEIELNNNPEINY